MMGAEWTTDVTLVSNSWAGGCEWDIDKTTTNGSDHYPVKIKLKPQSNKLQGNKKWNFNKAQWNTFKYTSEHEQKTYDRRCK